MRKTVAKTVTILWHLVQEKAKNLSKNEKTSILAQWAQPGVEQREYAVNIW